MTDTAVMELAFEAAIELAVIIPLAKAGAHPVSDLAGGMTTKSKVQAFLKNLQVLKDWQKLARIGRINFETKGTFSLAARDWRLLYD